MEPVARRLLDCWVAWDDKPGNEQTAENFEVEVGLCAKALGITASQLRFQLSSARRRKVPRFLAVEQALAPLAEGA